MEQVLVYKKGPLLGGWSKEKRGREKWWVFQLEILARGTRKIHFSIFGTVPTIPKSLRTAKMDPAKAERAQNCAHKSPFQLNFTKISSFIGSVAF
jgi:hypothetical protein